MREYLEPESVWTDEEPTSVCDDCLYAVNVKIDGLLRTICISDYVLRRSFEAIDVTMLFLEHCDEKRPESEW